MCCGDRAVFSTIVEFGNEFAISTYCEKVNLLFVSDGGSGCLRLHSLM